MGASQGPRRAGPSYERLIDELAQLGAQRIGARRQQLGEEVRGDALLAVDPERRAGRAAPGDLALGGEHLRGCRVLEDREPQPEPVAAELRLRERSDRARERLQLGVAGEMVAG